MSGREADRFFSLLKALIENRLRSEEMAPLWNEFGHLIRLKDLSGWVYHRYLLLSDQNGFKGEPPREFRRDYLRNLRYNTILLSETRRICDAINDLRAAVVQGIGFLLTLGADPGIRRIGDIDFIVSESDFEKMAQRLIDLGYRKQAVDGVFSWDYGGHVELVRNIGKKQVLVDVSTRTRLPISLLSEIHLKHLDRFLKGTASISKEVPLVSPAHLFLIILANFERKGFHSLKHLIDLTLMTRSEAFHLDWKAISESMDTKGSKRLMCAVLDFCRHRLGAAIPEWVFRKLNQPGGRFSRIWLDSFLDPTAILANRTQTLQTEGKFPTFRTMVFWLMRRMTAASFPEREARILGLFFSDRAMLNTYLFRSSASLWNILPRWGISSCLILLAYIVSAILYLAGGTLIFFNRRTSEK